MALGFAGAEYIRQQLGIEDEDIINAVRYHTVARAGMAGWSRLFTFADLTSSERDYPDVERMRRLSDRSLREGMREALVFAVSIRRSGMRLCVWIPVRHTTNTSVRGGRLPPVEQKKALKMFGGKKFEFTEKIAAIVVAAACLIAAVVVSYSIGYQRGAKGRTVLTETAQSEQDGQTGTYEGDDIQPLEEDIISVLCCGVDNTQELTDVIMYAQFDTRSGKVNVLRIPRDTFVGSQFPTAKSTPSTDIRGRQDRHQTLTDYLRDNWKLDIDYYATIDLASVRDIVDDMGGVTMDIQQQINYLPGRSCCIPASRL